jgi:hypothetical protein
MTSTKIIYVIAAVVPFGFVALAGFALIHTLIKRHRLQVSRTAAAIA